MIKEFHIKDILNAVETISKIDKKDRKIDKEKISNHNYDILPHNKQVKSAETDILVLNEMIE
tara:strand:- start:406 stop:591 length:186 start_codon:yes stop_codon:yes gene_type:complete